PFHDPEVFMNNLGERSQAVGGTGCIAETAIACQMSGRATPSPLLLLYQVESTSAIPAIELEFGMTPPTYSPAFSLPPNTLSHLIFSKLKGKLRVSCLRRSQKTLPGATEGWVLLCLQSDAGCSQGRAVCLHVKTTSLSQITRVQIPILLWSGSQPYVTPAPGLPTASSGLPQDLCGPRSCLSS
ncbi:mCG146242, partial [Mus musculus]